MSTGQVIDLQAHTALTERDQREERMRDPRGHRPKWQRKLARRARKELPVELALKEHKRQKARAEKREQKPKRGTYRDKAGTRRGRQYRQGKHKTRVKLIELAA